MCYNVQAHKRSSKNLGIAQMVARYLGVVEAVGSNPATQTKQDLSEHFIGTDKVLLFYLKIDNFRGLTVQYF